MKREKPAKALILLPCLFAVLVAGATILLIPWFSRLSAPENRELFNAWISDLGGLGLLAVTGLQVLQVVIAFLPGEPVEVLAGVLYGAWGGLLLCLAGCVLASSVIFSLSKRFGRKLLVRLFGADQVDSWKWLQDSRRTGLVTFVLFFIPGTPKDFLTYIVGVSQMGLGKFLAISTLARVPSVLTSSMIGASVRRGDWLLALTVFGLTGAAGIAGILTHDRVVARLRKRTGRGRTVSRAQGLDLLHPLHPDRYPILYCHMALTGRLDADRLRRAVERSSRAVPEILCGFRAGRFVDLGLAAGDALVPGPCEASVGPRWDLAAGPQLRLWVHQRGDRTWLTAGISHVLCDGAGFMQYLYLLAALYADSGAEIDLHNTRTPSPALLSVRPGRATEQERWGRCIPTPPLPLSGPGADYTCLAQVLTPSQVYIIKKKAKVYAATFNDALLTAYARVVAGELGTGTVLLPCPADLRRLVPGGGGLTVANLTGLYRVPVTVRLGDDFAATLAQVQIELQLQKSRNRCLAGISALNACHGKIPAGLLRRLAGYRYPNFPVSYTNAGQIDSGRLRFPGCEMDHCFLSGTYRKPPDFQLSASTFAGACTLSTSIIGGPKQRECARRILRGVRDELISWG